MASTFSNPRWDALPCERMRDCSFADDFISLPRIAQNHGTLNGAGHSADRGLTLTGAGDVTYDTVTQPGDFSVVFQFSTTLDQSNKFLLYNVNGGTDQCKVGLNYGAVFAKLYGTNQPEVTLSVSIDYTDGETHTVTYTVDKANGEHFLYVDSLAAATGALTIDDDETGAIIKIGGTGAASRFTGTITKARIFDAVLTEAEHDMYHAGTITSFLNLPTASYRCDDRCNDTIGHKLWDRTYQLNDTTKGDGSTSSTFPTFDTDHYKFDYVDDYITLPTLPTTYTIGALSSIPQDPWKKDIQQDNDTTFSALLTGSGMHWGNLHSLVIYPSVLTQMQLNHDEYQQKYWTTRSRAEHQYNRLITEGTCKLAVFLDDRNTFLDCNRLVNGSAKLVTQDGLSGCTFGSATSAITYEDDAELRSEDLTIAVLGTFTGSVAAGTIVDKGTNYKFLTNGNQLDFNGSTIAHTFSNDEFIAVTIRTGFKPRFFVDGIYIGEGTTTETPDSTDTTDLVIGNNNELNSRTQYAIKHVYIGNKPLTDEEIWALYESAQLIGATSMETGSRSRDRTTGSAAIDVDVTPGTAFQLLQVAWSSDAAPTTSENIIIKIINGATDDQILHTYDPSIDGDTNVVFTFDSRWDSSDVIAVDYANTDTNAIVVNVYYQLDPSV